MNYILVFSIPIVFTILMLGILQALELYNNPYYESWPAVTRCRVCNKRIWVWQKHERRENLKTYNVSSSSLYHKKCEGTVPGSVTIK